MNALYTTIRLSGLLTKPWRKIRLHRAMPDMRRIWVHKPDHLGDYLLARAALAMLQTAWPQATLTVACHPAAQPLVELDGHRAFAWASPFLHGTDRVPAYRQAVRDTAPDLLVNLRHDWRDMLLCTTLDVPRVVSYDHRGAASLATHPGAPPVEQRYEADNHAALLHEALALPIVAASPLSLTTPLIATAQQVWEKVAGAGPRIALHAAARTPAKTWPAAHWRELIALLHDRLDARLLLLGGPSDRPFDRLLAADRPYLFDATGRFTIVESAALIAQADLSVGVDSGPAHLARAVGTPVVTIMSGANVAARWAADATHALVHPVPCAPCRQERCPVPGHPCLSGLRPGNVWEMIERVLPR
ncbi:MAG TPA: glycosyltransferase family 9 protein [bacterium]|nr:glycosyltransferase family 9 protein [bacterium]